MWSYLAQEFTGQTKLDTAIPDISWDSEAIRSSAVSFVDIFSSCYLN